MDRVSDLRVQHASSTSILCHRDGGYNSLTGCPPVVELWAQRCRVAADSVSQPISVCCTLPSHPMRLQVSVFDGLGDA